jgi:hypothetical protein
VDPLPECFGGYNCLGSGICTKSSVYVRIDSRISTQLIRSKHYRLWPLSFTRIFRFLHLQIYVPSRRRGRQLLGCSPRRGRSHCTEHGRHVSSRSIPLCLTGCFLFACCCRFPRGSPVVGKRRSSMTTFRREPFRFELVNLNPDVESGLWTDSC